MNVILSLLVIIALSIAVVAQMYLLYQLKKIRGTIEELHNEIDGDKNDQIQKS